MINNTGYNNFLTAQQFQVEDFYNVAASGVNRTNFVSAARTANTAALVSHAPGGGGGGLISHSAPQVNTLLSNHHQQQQQQQLNLQPQLQQQQQHQQMQHLQLQTTTSVPQQNGGIFIVTNSELAKYNELFSHWKEYRLNHLKVKFLLNYLFILIHNLKFM